MWQWYDPGRGTRWCYDDEPEDEAAEEGEEREEEAVICRSPCIAELGGEPLSRVKMKREKKRRKKKRKSRRRRKKRETP